MKTICYLGIIALTGCLAACATVRGVDDVDQGRQALLEGHYQRALGLFTDAEKVDPNYVYGTELMGGVSSYLGRTQYLTGDYAQARVSLTKALSQHRSDNLARLYLGLTQYRLGDGKDGLANIQRGMQGIYNWLEYMNTNFALEFGQDWDTGGTIRAGIKKNLAMISSGNVNWPQLVNDAESLGIRIENEQDYFRTQSIRS